MRWAVAITATAKRLLDTLLPQTLASLEAAGFDRSCERRLFVDGAECGDAAERFGLPVTTRYPKVRAYMNWLMALLEMFGRHPDADRYLVSQDDVLFYRNLRPYLEQAEYPSKSYLNLYTFPENEKLAPLDPTGRRSRQVGWFPSNQLGKGALCLIFDRQAVIELFSHTDSARHLINRPLDAHRGWRAIDGAVVTAMKKAGYREMCHCPSLCHHLGIESSMNKSKHATDLEDHYTPFRWPASMQALSFRGEQFDALALMKEWPQ